MPGIRQAQPWYLKPLGMKIEWIDTQDQPYLVRTHLTPWRHWPFKWRLYLHKFYRPDADRVFHDHPWWFKTLVLWGGYDELSHVRDQDDLSGVMHGRSLGYQAIATPTGRLEPDRLGWLSFRSRRPQHAHKITRLHTPTVVTLIIRGARERDWGFWCPPADYRDETGQDIVSRVNNDTPYWRWVYWRDYLDVQDPKIGEAY